MGKIINQFNKEMKIKENKQQQEKAELSNNAKLLESYHLKMQTKETFSAVFDVLYISKGRLETLDSDGIRIVMASESLGSVYTGNQYKDSRLAGISIKVRVDHIDDKDNTVYVVPVGSIRTGASVSPRARLLSEINKELEKGKRPVVFGRIQYVSQDKAYVNICEQNISGVIYVKNWSRCYTRFLSEVCKVGEIYPFEVTGIKHLKDADVKDTMRGTRVYLDRVNLSVDPWDMFSKDSFSENDVIMVKCIEKPIGKSYWWGTSKFASGIEIVGNYNHHMSVPLFCGITYKCRIREFDPDRHFFQVTPFEVCEADKEKAKNMIAVSQKADTEEITETTECTDDLSEQNPVTGSEVNQDDADAE